MAVFAPAHALHGNDEERKKGPPPSAIARPTRGTYLWTSYRGAVFLAARISLSRRAKYPFAARENEADADAMPEIAEERAVLIGRNGFARLFCPMRQSGIRCRSYWGSVGAGLYVSRWSQGIVGHSSLRVWIQDTVLRGVGYRCASSNIRVRSGTVVTCRSQSLTPE